ncbi:branched chain amino acid aminotransferase [Candidatus Woesearchaeota archaeon]|jgi:branched-chain amino acid aminotransferase|nr:branched chain amino acid aminotransferase [Candidatus Woesearchaeota archaeon]MDP6647976.1 aminotransferase class IV [Candidatus Woesearchaeota archaeon]|tara:strand:+ start:13663 stop:14802 length:1140 start_codon:yes stop_codon:yes gene_type:complete
MKLIKRLIPVSERRTEQYRPTEDLPFGKERSPHMALMDFDGESWVNARIVPYGNLSIAPGAGTFDYGHGIFESQRAFLHPDGEVHIFRYGDNAQRMNFSADRLCMPELPAELHEELVNMLVDVDRLSVPDRPDHSLYIRSKMIGTEDSLGVREGNTYLFCAYTSPSGPIYPGGLSTPVKLLLTSKYHRAGPGGTGAIKAGGNYAGSFKPRQLARSIGADDVLYLDVTDRFLQEVGATNYFQVLDDGTFVIPKFSDTILRSITALTALEICRDLDIPFRQDILTLDGLVEGLSPPSPTILENGVLGTAAGIKNVGSFVLSPELASRYGVSDLIVGDGNLGEITRRVHERYTKVTRGLLEDTHRWLKKVERNQGSRLEIAV